MFKKNVQGSNHGHWKNGYLLLKNEMALSKKVKENNKKKQQQLDKLNWDQNLYAWNTLWTNGHIDVKSVLPGEVSILHLSFCFVFKICTNFCEFLHNARAIYVNKGDKS